MSCAFLNYVDLKGIMSATIKEIASKASVSIATVSRALNNDPRVVKKTREHIIKIAKSLEYRPNILAQSFAKKKSNLIGLILPEISDEFFTEIIKGVDEIAFSQKFYTIVASSHKYKSLKEEIVTFIKSGFLSGIILLASNLDDELIKILFKGNLPIVLINSDKKIKKFERVAIDDYQGAYAMTQYLIKIKNYKFLSHISGPVMNDDANLRKSGFIDACKNFKVKYIIENGDFSKEAGYDACKRIMERSERAQVIFAANDMMAIGCYNYLRQNNLEIPKDVAIAGFDDVFVSQYLDPPLTTVRVNVEEVGKQAAALLLNKIHRFNGKPSSVINIPAELIIRKSC